MDSIAFFFGQSLAICPTSSQLKQAPLALTSSFFLLLYFGFSFSSFVIVFVGVSARVDLFVLASCVRLVIWGSAGAV